jgi:prophage regulatory protein
VPDRFYENLPLPQPLDRFLVYEDLRPLGVNFCPNHLRRMEEANQFPKRVKISARRIAWSEAEVRAWIAQRIAGRGDAATIAPVPVMPVLGAAAKVKAPKPAKRRSKPAQHAPPPPNSNT